MGPKKKASGNDSGDSSRKSSGNNGAKPNQKNKTKNTTKNSKAGKERASTISPTTLKTKDIPSLQPENADIIRNSSTKYDAKDYGSTTSSQSTTARDFILGRKSRLGGLLSSQEIKTKPVKRSFEEDDGFVFQREGEVSSKKSTKAKPPKKRVTSGGSKGPSQISTPISRLHKELSKFSDDDDDDDIEVHIPIPKSNGHKKSKTINKPTTIRNPPTIKSRQKDQSPEEVSLGLSSPIRSPVYNNEQEYGQYSSDDYVEQVSHHQLKLPNSEDEDERRKHQTQKSKLKSSSNQPRRASYHNRGKRISSVGNGFVGVPHSEIPPSNYYKLLDTSLPEPHRMRQLLIWCFRKRLDQEEKEVKNITNTEEKSVVYIAKVIKEEVLRDLIGGQIETSWYNRGTEDEDEEVGTHQRAVKLLPNPLNISNKESIKIYQEKLQKLLDEKKEWSASFGKYTKRVSKLNINPTDDSSIVHKRRDGLYSSVLDETIVKGLEKSVDDISKESTNIEKTVDKFSDIAYRLSQGSRLSEILRKNELNGKISDIVNNYMTNKYKQSNTTNNNINNDDDDDDNNNDEKESEPIKIGGEGKEEGPVELALRTPTTRELLRGIARLDARED
ncbi:hypothetical protein CAAN1_05S04742 [[Candida] anglica]|uniref:Kinetochore protein mis13 n=1 Tax=[Candida] anglica TaxID=148631 RepID=A0ABP0EDK1_9ASCO